MDTLSLDYNTADSATPHLLVAGDRIVGRIREQKDAQEIITACNAHDQLVSALQVTTNDLAVQIEKEGKDPASDSRIRIARAAIAKATAP